MFYVALRVSKETLLPIVDTYMRVVVFDRHMNVKKVEGKVVSKEVGPRFEMKCKLLLIWNCIVFIHL